MATPFAGLGWGEEEERRNAAFANALMQQSGGGGSTGEGIESAGKSIAAVINLWSQQQQAQQQAATIGAAAKDAANASAEFQNAQQPGQPVLLDRPPEPQSQQSLDQAIAQGQVPAGSAPGDIASIPERRASGELSQEGLAQPGKIDPFASHQSMISFLAQRPDYDTIVQSGKLGEFLALAEHPNAPGGLSASNAGNYTADSIKVFQAGGGRDFSKLVPRTEAKAEPAKTMPAAAMEGELGLPAGSLGGGVWSRDANGKPVQVQAAAKPSIPTVIGGLQRTADGRSFYTMQAPGGTLHNVLVDDSGQPLPGQAPVGGQGRQATAPGGGKTAPTLRQPSPQEIDGYNKALEAGADPVALTERARSGGIDPSAFGGTSPPAPAQAPAQTSPAQAPAQAPAQTAPASSPEPLLRPAPQEKALNETQAKFALYATAAPDLGELENLINKHGTPNWQDSALQRVKSITPEGGALGLAGTAALAGSRVGGLPGAIGGGALGYGLGTGGLPLLQDQANKAQSDEGRQFYAVAGRLRDVITRAYSGAAAPEREALQYLLNNIPGYADDEATVRSKLGALKRNMHILQEVGSGKQLKVTKE